MTYRMTLDGVFKGYYTTKAANVKAEALARGYNPGMMFEPVVEEKKSRQQEWQEKKVLAGKCMICGRPRDSKYKNHCFNCYVKVAKSKSVRHLRFSKI